MTEFQSQSQKAGLVSSQLDERKSRAQGRTAWERLSQDSDSGLPAQSLTHLLLHCLLCTRHRAVLQ